MIYLLLICLLVTSRWRRGVGCSFLVAFWFRLKSSSGEGERQIWRGVLALKAGGSKLIFPISPWAILVGTSPRSVVSENSYIVLPWITVGSIKYWPLVSSNTVKLWMEARLLSASASLSGWRGCSYSALSFSHAVNWSNWIEVNFQAVLPCQLYSPQPVLEDILYTMKCSLKQEWQWLVYAEAPLVILWTAVFIICLTTPLGFNDTGCVCVVVCVCEIGWWEKSSGRRTQTFWFNV